MKHLRTARAVARRLVRQLVKFLPDAHVYAGIGLVAYGAGQIGVGPIGAALAPIVAGVGLVLIVRLGAPRGAH